MPRTADITVFEGDLVRTLANFFRSLLESGVADAILVPCRTGPESMIMPTLIRDPDRIADADPLALAFPVNAARLLSRLTRRPSGGKLAAVMRPCEIRAFVELVKLNQGRTDDLLLIGLDCPGAYPNREFFTFTETGGTTRDFIESVLPGSGDPVDAPHLAPACRVCTRPTPDEADLAVGLFGRQDPNALPVLGQTAAGEQVLDRLGLQATGEAPGRQAAIDRLIARRRAEHERMTETTRAATDSPEKLAAWFSRCVNCYNCRVACPVCYCRECVFLTDVFDHEPAQYIRWAGRKGALKMPSDTLFYHLTRMAHISTACVGCGQCSNACPSGIPLAELFISVAAETQAAFGYIPGTDMAQPPPLATFEEAEFEDVVGIE